MSELNYHPIEEIISDISSGKIVIVVDDPSRENEADLVCAAEKITPKLIAFMANHGKGLICAPITQQRALELDLPPMSQRNRESHQTAFTISVDAKEGITTGISAADRARTIRLLSDPSADKETLVQPGHIFPLQGVSGGVLRRAGHTEASIDLAKLADLQPSGVICEIMNEDGTMARAGDLGEYQEKHLLKACTIADLIAYRRLSENLIRKGEKITMTTDYGDFDCHMYCLEKESEINQGQYIAMTRGDISPDEPVLVRVHSECNTADIIDTIEKDRSPQLDAAMSLIADNGGVLLYLRQEAKETNRPPSLEPHNDQGLIETDEKLGSTADLRDYGVGAQILHDLGVRKIKLLTNNPKNVIGLEGYDLEIVEQIPLSTPSDSNTESLLGTDGKQIEQTL